VLALPGRPAQEIMGATRHAVLNPDVQVICRGVRGDPDEPKARARACRDALNRGALSGYISCVVPQSDASFLGKNNTECFRFSIVAETRKDYTP